MRLLENGYPIDLGKQKIQNQNVRLLCGEQSERLLSVAGNSNDLIAAGLFKRSFQMSAEFLILVGNQNFDAIFHMLSSPQ